MKLPSAHGSFTDPKRTRFGGTVVLFACSALVLAACGSSGSSKATTTTSPSSTKNANPTNGSPVTSTTPSSTTLKRLTGSQPVANATSGTTALKKCPSATMVNAALGQHGSGPVVSGTAVYEICTYKGSGVVPTKITISVGTRTEFATSEHNVAAGLTVVSVPGLGDEAWAPKGSGSIFVLKGSLQVEVLSPLSTAAQVQALARQII